MSPECVCGKPLGSTSICADCSQKLQIALGDVSSHWKDLDTVKGRHTRYGGSGGGRGGDKPLPVDARFLGAGTDGTVLQDAVKNTVATWTRVVMEAKPILSGPAHSACGHLSCSTVRRSHPPADHVPACVLYLLGYADWIATQHWAPEILDEIVDTAEHLRRFVDRPADRWFAGPCDGCERDLYAKAGASWVRCDTCDVQYDVQDRRKKMLLDAHDRHATAAEIARAVSWLDGQPLAADRIRKWAERKRLTRKGWLTVRGRELPTYRIGDVAELAADSRPRTGS